VNSNRAFIFGGETASGKLAGNEIHSVIVKSSDTPEPQYSVIPAVPKEKGGKVPAARTRHASCAFNVCVAVYGGVDDAGQLVDNDSSIWLFRTDVEGHCWESLEASNKDVAAPQPRSSAKIFDYNNNLIIYGGVDASGTALTDCWHFNYVLRTWSRFPDAPVSTDSVGLSDGVLHLISDSQDRLSGDLQILPLNAKTEEERIWHTITFPTNPLTPGPLPRTGAGLLPVSTGFGRQYLLYLFGAQHANGNATQSEDEAPAFYTDMWTYQLPSTTPEVKATTNVLEAMKPAKIKDAIRGALGVDSGKHSWYEVEVLPPSDLLEPAGKVHPGPRSFFAYDVMDDKRTVVLWGGMRIPCMTASDQSGARC